jgi:hypothetical protein
MYSKYSAASCTAASVISIAKAKFGPEFRQSLARRPDAARGLVLKSGANRFRYLAPFFFLFREQAFDRFVYQFLRRSVIATTDPLRNSFAPCRGLM